MPVLYGIILLSSQPLQFIKHDTVPADLAERQIDGIIDIGRFAGDGIVAESATDPGWGQHLNDSWQLCNGNKNSLKGQWYFVICLDASCQKVPEKPTLSDNCWMTWL